MLKQRISYTHLQKLDEQQQNKLRELWEPQEGEYMATGDHEEMIYFINGVQKNKSLPLLSLGQMMACLSQTGEKLSVNFSEGTWESLHSTIEPFKTLNYVLLSSKRLSLNYSNLNA